MLAASKKAITRSWLNKEHPDKRGMDWNCRTNLSHGKADFLLKPMHGQIHKLMEKMVNSF